MTVRSPVLAGDELAGLLSDLAEAPDFAAAAALIVEQFLESAGAARGALLTVDRRLRSLDVTAMVGLDEDALETRRAVSLDREGHPLVVAALCFEVVTCDARALEPVALPFARALLLPLPQPLDSRAPQPPSSSARALDTRRGAAEVVAWSGGDPRRRRGHQPFAVLVLEGVPESAVIESLATAALLAGPVLARTSAADRLRRSAERLDEQRNLLTTIINALPDPIVITDATNSVVVQNRRAELLLMPREGDSEGRRRAVEINNLLFSSFLSKAVLTGGIRSTARELNLVDPDEGTDLLFEVLAHPLPRDLARDGAYVSVLRDVTDLKRASIELERQFGRMRVTEMEATRERDRLNLILNNVGDPILVTDDQAKIILMNPLAEQLFELAAGHADRQQLQRVRGNDTKFTTLISDFAISPANFRRASVALVRPLDGTEVPMEVVAGKVLNERGEPLAIVSVLHDLTKQVENERLYLELKTLNAQLEDRIRSATSDLEAQNLRLQWQSAELEKAYRLKSEFLANMSHELRTPINALIGYTALMLDRIYGELSPRQVEGLTRIQASSQHLLALINDILDLAKIEAGKMPVHLEPAPLQPVLMEVVAQIEPLARRKGLDLTVEIDDGLPILYTDRTKVKQIALNLLSNAVKFTHRGSVALEATLADPYVVLTVRDTGIGIRREHLDVIFEEFRQVDQSRTREFGGTGLGLSITRKLIALLGGRIAVESEYGAGTTFTVRLPLRSDVFSVDEQVTRAMLAEQETGNSTRGSSRAGSRDGERPARASAASETKRAAAREEEGG